MAVTPAILAIDVGSTTIKAAAVTADGQLIGLHHGRTPYLSAPPPVSEIEMNALAASTLLTMSRVVNALSAQRVDVQIQAIAITALGDGVWLLDANGQAIEPALTWRDARSIDVLRRWRREGRLDRVARYTGTRPTTAHQTTQLAWLTEVAPERLKHARHVCFAEDWIGFVLTGCIGVCATSFEHTYGHPHTILADHETASSDDYTRVAQIVLDILNLDAVHPMIPEVRSPLEPRGKLKQSVARRIGLPEGLPVFVGPFDVVAGMFGLNAVDFSKAVSIIGTAAVHQCWTKKFCSNMPGYLVRHIQDKNIFLRFIATSAGMINLEFWAKILYPDLRENNDFWISIEENLNLASDRLIYLPYLTFGEERSEEKEWSLGGCFLGLNSGHTRENLMYAVYEGIALQTARIYDLLLDHNCLQQIEEIRFGGGGARSNLLASLIAQSTGVQVVCPHLDEIGLIGIAAVAWTALHPNSLLDYWTQNMLKSSKIKIFIPNAKNEERYKALKEYVDNIVSDLSKVKINRMSSL